MALTDTGANRCFTGFLGTDTNLFFSLHTAAVPSSTNELSGNGYARAQVARTSLEVTDSGGHRRLRNTTVIEFPTPTANWPDVMGIGLWTESSGGSLIAADGLDNDPDAPVDGATVRIAVGSWSITINTVD